MPPHSASTENYHRKVAWASYDNVNAMGIGLGKLRHPVSNETRSLFLSAHPEDGD